MRRLLVMTTAIAANAAALTDRERAIADIGAATGEAGSWDT